tara:strand:- start:3421 stop:4002 length:582 start_codon:yes stop_codon:yes gene_type:complete
MKKLILTTLLIIFIVSIQSCDDDDDDDKGPTTQLAIGDFHEGGVIFYLDSTGEHGLISAVRDQGFNIQWGCPTAVDFGAKGLIIGTGIQNTIDILDRCDTQNIAADLCDTYTYDGYEDWFLPSKDELDSLYQHKDIVEETALKHENGEIFFDVEYWSSSHDLENTVWTQSFHVGSQISEQKIIPNYVRAIRSF